MKNGKNLPGNLIVNYHKGITSISPPQRVAMRIKYIYWLSKMFLWVFL